MKASKRELPEHLTDNVFSKCFVFRHPNLFRRKSVIFSYAHGRDYETIKLKAVTYAVKMNEVLGPIPHLSPEGRMSSRNTSGIVRVNPRRTRAPRNGLFYYSWNTKWKGCTQRGGVSWPCLAHTDDGAYVLAALTLELRTINRDRVIETYEKIKGTKKFKEVLRMRPKFPIEDFWPDNS
ncbi:MAG: hypothetical protein PHY43_05525 [Verrucomicrobiales bacterium]|nr:hypothetical protein [Verrucomicrobiales bacterium]